MSVLIKGLEMPRHCTECLFCKRSYDEAMNYVYFICIVDGTTCKISSCPLIPIPDHGDLIDRDALFDDNSWDWFNEWGSTVNTQAQLVADAPVIIPAERSEDGET